MPTGDVWAVKLHMEFAGQQCRPGFYMIEGSGEGSTVPAFGAAFHVLNLIGVDGLTGFSSSLSLLGVEAQDVQPGTSRSAFVGVGVPTAGDGGDDNPLPPHESTL